MPEAETNGVKLYYELRGTGEPMVLVHGSWGDATEWEQVVPGLSESFQVLVYDRRGHFRSERPDTAGSVAEDGDDLAGLLEALELSPAHVVTNSFGGNIALGLAIRRPEVFRSLTCHEPPVWGLLRDDPESAAMLEAGARTLESVGRKIAQGDHEDAARQFVDEIAFEPGAWDHLPPDVRDSFVRNAPTFLDELEDPTQLEIDTDALTRLRLPVVFTEGSDSPPVFGRVVDRLTELLPDAGRETIEGAEHVPHMTNSESYVESTLGVVQRIAA